MRTKRWLGFCCALACAAFTLHAAHGQFTQVDMQTMLTGLKNGSDPHQVSIAVAGQEGKLKSATENRRREGLLQIADLAAAIYSTRNLEVSLDPMPGRTPDFDASKVGGKPVFAGADPKSIADPRVRKAYEEALQEHDKLLEKVGSEFRKREEADYCVAAGRRVIEASPNPDELIVLVQQHLADQKTAPWIIERITEGLVPMADAREQGARPSEHSGGSAATGESSSRDGGTQTPVAVASENPTAKQSRDGPAGLWIAGAVLFASLLGGFWLMRGQKGS